MPDYAKMYRHLFNSQTDAVKILQKAQQETEEMYMSAPDTKIKLLPEDGDKSQGSDKK